MFGRVCWQHCFSDSANVSGRSFSVTHSHLRFQRENSSIMCVRHESKLRFIKQSSIRGNFKNICKTAINKHQRWLCYQLKYNSILVSLNVELGPTKSDCTLAREPKHIHDQIQVIPDLSVTSVVYRPKWLQILLF